MPTEDAIEIFNCTLCSHCETSLDGLAGHIRKHIKPEPEGNRVNSNHKNSSDGNTITCDEVETIVLVNGADSSVESPSTVSSNASIKDLYPQDHNESTNPLSPRIEVINPRTVVTVNGAHNVPTNDSQRMQPVVSTYKSYYVPPPPQQQSSYPRNIAPQQQSIRNSSMHADGRLENIAPAPPPPRYVQLHPREPQYIDINSPHHPFTNQQYVGGKPSHHGHMNIPRNIAPAPPLSSPNRLTNDAARMRSPYDVANQNNMHHNYQNRHGLPQMDANYRHPNQSVKSQRPSHSASASPYNSSILSPHNHKQSDDRMKQYHLNRMSGGLQLAEMQKHASPHGVMGIPNSGSVYLNPEQVFGAGNANLDHLAGVLVVPLKKTSEVACQTDNVHITGATNTNGSTRGIQTDLLMGQVRVNSQSSTPVFGTFRSTDDMYECLVCGEEFASDHHLQEHVSKMHTHVCENCHHSSTTLNEHNMHITDCGNPDTQMICLECNTTFASLKKLHQHRSKIHNVRMPFRCGVCNVPFETHEAVMKHISTHDMDVPEFKCRYCIKVFQSADGLSKHILRHKGVEVLHECRFCKKSYSTSKLLNDHIGYVHVIRDSEKPVFAVDSPAKPERSMGEEIASKKHPLCSHCDLAFKNAEFLAQHIKNCSKNSDATASAFVCDVCKEFYASDVLRKQHMKKEHKRESGFRCPKCSKIYRTWSRLKFHTKQQHLKKVCSDCPMIFTKEHILRKHQEEEHGKPQGQPGDRVYTCSLCHTMLNTLTELMNHRKEVHPELSEMRTADRSSNATMLSYIDNNGSSTSSKTDEAKQLKTYPVRGHAAEGTSFKCGTCGLLFEDEKRLKNHKGLIHGEKPFKCNLCSKAFQYSSQVVWHMRSHKQQDKTSKVSSKLWKSKNKKFASAVHSAKQLASKARCTYVCQFCGAKFSQEKLLKNHKGSVHKIKLFSCDICSFQCGHSTELIWHVRTCRAKFKRKYPDSEYPTKENKIARIESEGDNSESDGYVCHVCDNAFTIFENYQSHMKTHPGEDPVFPSETPEGGDSSSNDPTVNKQENGFNNISGSATSTQANFTVEELLNIEPEFDQSIGEYVCPVCQKTTRSMTGMKTHYGRVHGVWSEGTSHIDNVKPKPVEEFIWPCKNCDRQFASLGSLRHHSSVIHGFSVNKEDVDVIPRTDVPLPSPPATSSTQSLTSQDDAGYSCPYCDVVFTKSKSIRVHAFKKHGTVLTDDVVNQWRVHGSAVNVKKQEPLSPAARVVTNIEENPETVRYRCYKCKTKFRSTKSLRVHSLKQHNLLLSKKEMLRTKFRIKLPDGAAAAVRQIPTATSPTKTPTGDVFPCEFCGRVFTSHRAYFTHYRQAHRDATEQIMSTRKPSKNEIVNYTPPLPSNESPLPSGSQLQAAKAETPSANMVECPTCGNMFKSVKGLYTHLYAAHHYTKEHYPALFPNGLPTEVRKEAKCPTCEKVCIDQRAMRIHIFKAHGILYKEMTEEDLEAATANEDLSDENLVNGTDEGTEEDSNDNELRVLEAELGPPNCFICGRLFKSRRALMTHEYKYHGIRWVGNKRIFPEHVRNVPNTSNYPANAPGQSTDSPLYSGFNSLDENPMDSEVDYTGESESPVPELARNEPCPKCPLRFQNRRALTTHLVRIHKFKKQKIHAYFDSREPPKTDVNNEEIAFDQDIAYPEGNGHADEVTYNENENSDIEVEKGKEEENDLEIFDTIGMEEGPENFAEEQSLENLVEEAESTFKADEEVEGGGETESYEAEDDGDVENKDDVGNDGEALNLDDATILEMDDDEYSMEEEEEDVYTENNEEEGNLVDINDNTEGDCDTIKQSDIEAYEDIGKNVDDIELNGEFEETENMDVNDIDSLIIFNGKYDLNVNGGPFDEIST